MGVGAIKTPLSLGGFRALGVKSHFYCLPIFLREEQNTLRLIEGLKYTVKYSTLPRKLMFD